MTSLFQTHNTLFFSLGYSRKVNVFVVNYFIDDVVDSSGVFRDVHIWQSEGLFGR